jgi:hypothetical protein
LDRLILAFFLMALLIDVGLQYGSPVLTFIVHFRNLYELEETQIW